MTPAEEAGVVSGMEKSAQGGQTYGSHVQPPPPQTPDEHRRKTRRRAAALIGAAALATGVFLGRKHIAHAGKAGLEKMRNIRDESRIRKAKSWEEAGHETSRASTLKSMGRTPAEGTKLHSDVKKEFKDMGMTPPAGSKAPEDSAGKWRRRGWKALGIGATGTVVTIGAAGGAADSFNRRTRRQEDDETVGMRGVGR